jgi:6-pyruvoyltetrahydropterin/6-carboxytetrahydropterin synthase
MYQVVKSIAFCYGHRLLNHRGLCRHLHGHNARAVIVLESESLDALGMVVDFNDVKAQVKGWIDREIDHTMLLHRDDPFLPAMQQAGERVYVMDCNPTAENIARLIFQYVAAQGLPVAEVTLWETETSCARYRPDAAR